MVKEKILWIKKFGPLLFAALLILGCNKKDTTLVFDPIEDENSISELLPLPKGIISTASTGNPIDQRILDNPLVDGFMVIQAWNDIETSEGVFDWSHIDSEVNRASAANKVVRLAIHAGGESVPSWVKLNYSDIKEIYVYDKRTSEKRYHPAYWNSTFIDVKSNFYSVIGERYKDNPTVFGISASMVDPNTGDWFFRIDDELQKQAYLDAGFTEAAFIGAYKKLIDNAMVSFHNKYVITAVGGISSRLVDDNYVALYEVLNYAFETYGNQLIIAKGSLNANTPDPTQTDNLRLWQEMWDFRPHCAGQFVWGVTNDPEFKMNGRNEYSTDEKSAIYKRAFEIGIEYGLNWIEPWKIDLLNPDLQDELEYGRNKLIN